MIACLLIFNEKHIFLIALAEAQKKNPEKEKVFFFSYMVSAGSANAEVQGWVGSGCSAAGWGQAGETYW